MMRTTEVMSIKDFMNRSNEWKIEETELRKAVKKTKKNVLKIAKSRKTRAVALVALSVGLGFPISALASAVDSVTYSDMEAIPVGAVSGAMTEKVVHAFDPLIALLQALAYPVCVICMIIGCLFCMISSKDKGLSMIASSAIGFIGVKFIPFFMGILVEITKSL